MQRLPSQLLVASLFAGLLWSTGLPATNTARDLPDLGDESAASLSPREERRLGEDFMREARARLDLVDDPWLNEYLQQLGNRLVPRTHGQNGFHFFIVNNPTLNAFAVPGGFVGAHTGLLLAARSEPELAAVLAHETAHVTQRHIPRLLSASQRLSGPALAALLAGILIAASGQAGGEAVITLATAGLAQAQINFTRTYEQEADRIGMSYLDAAGFDARAMPAFFERMEAVGRLYETNLPEFLRTHPVTGRRIAESRDHAEGFPARKASDPTAFTHMQARLRVLGSKPEEALGHFRGAIGQAGSPHADADRYGLALALLVNRQFSAARQETEKLVRQRPDYPPYLLLRAEIELESGNLRQGLKLYGDTARLYPASTAVTRYYSGALLKAKQPGEARDLLDKAIRQHPDEPALYKLLATAAGESGRPLEAHRAFGEYYYRMGQPKAAIEQLEIALRYANKNFYYTSSLEARIREIRETSGLLFKDTEPRQDRAPPKKGK
jgi:predicted Zn-dependent protease